MKYFFWTLYPFVEDSVVLSLIENKDKSFGILLSINKQLIKKLKIIVSSVKIENSVRLKNIIFHCSLIHTFCAPSPTLTLFIYGIGVGMHQYQNSWF